MYAPPQLNKITLNKLGGLNLHLVKVDLLCCKVMTTRCFATGESPPTPSTIPTFFEESNGIKSLNF